MKEPEDNPDLYLNPSAMEPLHPESPSVELENLSIKLVECASILSNSIHPITSGAIADFLRPMNSYYSNLIEGHDTHPIDINSALNEEYSDDEKTRSLQIEARAHIGVHATICGKYSSNRPNPFTSNFIQFIHKDFHEHLPRELKYSKILDGVEVEVKPGEIREGEVKVGKHIGPSSENLNSFISRFSDFYAPESPSNSKLSRRIISIAAAHHRLAWIHPFIDGNGRVVRLFTDACFMYENLHASGLWSMSRGLARNEDEYKDRLANADMTRWDDNDGRGNLSNKMLIEFCKFFLEVAIDQVQYMSKVLQVDTMLKRIHSFVDVMQGQGRLKSETRYILEAVFLKGEIPRRDIERITSKSDKTAKLLAKSLIDIGLLETDNNNHLAPYRASYPITFSPILFSGLYPEGKEIDMMSLY